MCNRKPSRAFRRPTAPNAPRSVFARAPAFLPGTPSGRPCTLAKTPARTRKHCVFSRSATLGAESDNVEPGHARVAPVFGTTPLVLILFTRQAVAAVPAVLARSSPSAVAIRSTEPNPVHCRRERLIRWRPCFAVPPGRVRAKAVKLSVLRLCCAWPRQNGPNRIARVSE
jgi:hypothetical protein